MMNKKGFSVLLVVLIIVVLVGLGSVVYIKFSAPICAVNEDCGADFYSSNYCDSEAVKRDFVTFLCNNPGTKEASCEEDRNPEVVRDCPTPYACFEEPGDDVCLQRQCQALEGAAWLGGPSVSRVFFDGVSQRDQLSLIVMRTGATFRVNIFTDRNEEPERKIFTSEILSDEDIDDFGWVKLNVQNVEPMPSGHYWIGIDVTQYGDSAFNTCVSNDGKADTFGSDSTLENGQFRDGYNPDYRNEHDIVHLFE